MAIYHFSVKTFSKMTSACAIAKAAYRSGEKLHDDMQDRIYDYQHRENVLYSNIQIPDNCPEAYKDRETLWNAVESQKSNINSRFAREFEIALPNEWDIGKAKDYLNDFVKEQFVDKGMIADINIHQNHNNNNLHAHVMCTVDPVNEQGEFYGTERKVFANAAEIEIEPKMIKDKLDTVGIEYEIKGSHTIEIPAEVINNELLKETGIEISQKNIRASYNPSFPEFDKNNKEETEKHRLKEYDKNGEPKQRRSVRNGKEYYTQEYKRLTTEKNDWNSREQLKEWRKEWAQFANRYLEEEQQIDHRSYKDQGIDKIPTLHEGVQAKEIEERGEISEVKELNREIQQYNNLWDRVKEQVENLKYAVQIKFEEVKENIEYAKQRIEQFKEVRRFENGSCEYEGEATRQEQLNRSSYNSDNDYTGPGSDYRRSTELIERARAALGQSEQLAQERTGNIYERARAALNGSYTEIGAAEQRIKPDESTLAAERARAERSERDNIKLERERLRVERSQGIERRSDEGFDIGW